MPKKEKRLVLKNIIASDVINDYYHHFEGDARTLLQKASSQTDTQHRCKKNVTYFVDPHKNVSKYWVHMVDVHDYGALPIYTSKPCWWCRHSFSCRPLGIPIEYYPHEPSLPTKSPRAVALRKANLPIESNDFFITDGMFCSFPCTKAFIHDRRDESKYSNAWTLLPLLYTKLTNRLTIPISDAPHWKMLKDYGGHLLIDEFRKAFGKLDYIETSNLRRPYMYTCSAIVQECLKNSPKK